MAKAGQSNFDAQMDELGVVADAAPTFNLQAIRERCAVDHDVPAEQVNFLTLEVFPEPFKDGSIGEIVFEYAAPARAGYGLYGSGNVALWRD